MNSEQLIIINEKRIIGHTFLTLSKLAIFYTDIQENVNRV